MKKENGKEELLQAAVDLLNEVSDPERVTSRRLAEKAGVNAAMINYYFESKDQLLSLAAGKIIEASAQGFRPEAQPDGPPRQRLEFMLASLCEQVVKFEKFTKVYLPYVLLRDEILTPFYILPYLKEYFGASKTETDCKIIAYEIISFMQLVFLRFEAFYRFTGVDLRKKEERIRLIHQQLDLFLGGD